MTPTINSQQAIAKNDRFFFEQEIKRVGNFKIMYYAATGSRSYIGVVYDVTLLAGKEYEIYASFTESLVYEINPDGTTTKVQTHYPRTAECPWMKKIVKAVND